MRHTHYVAIERFHHTTPNYTDAFDATLFSTEVDGRSVYEINVNPQFGRLLQSGDIVTRNLDGMTYRLTRVAHTSDSTICRLRPVPATAQPLTVASKLRERRP